MGLDNYKASLERQANALRQARDELAVQLHLARADARDEWTRLEKSWTALQGELSRLGSEAKEEVGSTARHLMSDLQHGYERLRSTLKS